MSTPDPALRGRVLLRAEQGPVRQRLAITMLLAEAPKMSGGVGGWTATDRAQQRPAKWWTGQPSMEMSLSVILDRDHLPATVSSVDHLLLILTSFGRRRGNQPNPAPLRLAGDVRDPYSLSGGLWVLSGMELGDRLFTRRGTLRRQHVDLSLEDYDPVRAVKAVAVRRTRAGLQRPRKRVVRARRGDTLRSIAVREMGVSTGWQRLQQWNKSVRDINPEQPLRPGLPLVIK